MKSFKIIIMLGLISLGFISILATAPSPPPGFTVKNRLNIHARNPFSEPENVFMPESRPESHIYRYACYNEKIEISWSIEGSKKALLNASPYNSLEPKIKNRQLSGSNSMSATILGETNISLQSDYSFNEHFSIMPNLICSGFPIEPIGKFSGEVKQLTPRIKTSKQTATMKWGYFENAIQLIIVLPDTLAAGEANKAENLRCNYQAQTPNIVCMREASATNVLQLTIILNVTKNGLEGTYFGSRAEDWKKPVSFSGTLKLDVDNNN